MNGNGLEQHMIQVAVISAIIIGGSFFAITDRAFAQAKEPASKCEVAESKSTRLSAEQIEKFWEKISSCFLWPTGNSALNDLRVTAEIRLSIDGKIIGEPKVIAMSDDPSTRSAVEAFVSALVRCQPYQDFDRNKYDLWKRLRLNLDLGDK